MEEQVRRRLREQDLAFFGTITAGVSHEMRNVLSIIGEYAGLLDDFLAASERGKSVDSEKLKRVSTRIARQVKKGTEAMDRLSYIAHATDEQTASVDLAALARNVTVLAERNARLVGCTLDFHLPGKTVKTVTRPFSLQHAVFSAIQVMLGAMEKDQVLTIQLAREKSGAVISILADAVIESGHSGPMTQISTLMAELGGKFDTSVNNGKSAMVLTVPLQ